VRGRVIVLHTHNLFVDKFSHVMSSTNICMYINLRRPVSAVDVRLSYCMYILVRTYGLHVDIFYKMNMHAYICTYSTKKLK